MIYSQTDSSIIFTQSASEELKQLLAGWKGKVFILSDKNSEKYCLPKLMEKLDKEIHHLSVNEGEQHKNTATVVQIWEFLNRNGADRKSLLINLGGGVICDMGGFAASTFKRGIDFVQVPTTLLSQVDASVGGKTGINLNSYKNEIGCFSFPIKVIIDTGFLQTLDDENILSGYAEMLKHAYISGEAYLGQLLRLDLAEGKLDYGLLLELVKQSVQIKEKIVLADPMENGLRKVLNFGHTVGHAFESFFMGKPSEISHGKAVAYGMAAELCLSHSKLGFPKEKLAQSLAYIEKLYGKPSVGPSNFGALYDLMTHDKKNEASLVNFTLLKDVGAPMIDQTASREEVFGCLEGDSV
jgi:3-dehydroquinate synthase